MNAFDTSILIGFTVAIVEVLKTSFGLRKKFRPIVAVIVGILANVILNNDFTVKGVFNGILIGLSASGIYSGVKTQFERR